MRRRNRDARMQTGPERVSGIQSAEGWRPNSQSTGDDIAAFTMSETSFLRKKKILVVDDDPDLLELLRIQLRTEGFATATASDGIEAIRKARSLSPDLILLDVRLPELDGFAVCEILRHEANTAAIPIVMLSGLPGQLTRGAGIESGATDFVSKPISPADIVSRIKEIFLQRFAASAAVCAQGC